VDESEQKSLLMAPHVRPDDLYDGCIGTAAGLLQSAVLLVPPSWLVFHITDSVFAAIVTAVAVLAMAGLFAVRALRLTPQGIRFERRLGSTKFLKWQGILSIEPVTGWEVVTRGLFWPFPPRESCTTFSLRGHYRIRWNTGFCYFPPADREAFESYATSKIRVLG
jgi:hypothetical protein